jgi:tetratricopeptide (TPR) repeat protein
MQRYTLAGCALFLLFALSTPVKSADSPMGPFQSTDPKIHQWIALLADADPSVRVASVQKLIGIGEPARPALRRALVSATLQTRSEIDRVLLHVPWIKAGDDEIVERAFTGYAELDAEQRCERIDGFWLYPQPPAPVAALMRIIMNDPCSAVRWEAASAFGRAMDENDPIRKDVMAAVDDTDPPRQLYLPADQPCVPPPQNASLLALAGWAHRLDDPVRCEDLLTQSLALEQDHPSAFRGQMDFVFILLSDRAAAKRDYKRMIQLVREQAARTSWSEDQVPEAVSNLFAIQADYGPDAEFTQDLRMYLDYFKHPEMIYTLSRLATRRGHPLLGDLVDDVAMLMGGLDPEAHFAAGQFLTTHRWYTAAERELQFCLYLPNGDQTNVYLRLAGLAEERTDDLAAAKYMESALKKNSRSDGLVQQDRFGHSVPWPIDQAWAAVYVHYLRAAQQTHDLPVIQANLEKLLGTDNGQKLLAATPSMAADIVPALQTVGRTALADSIFSNAYTALKAEMTAEPQDPMPKNNLAWLCACAGKKLVDAAQWAAQAVALAPDDGACLDTQAEVYMRQGQPAKAAEIEAKALQSKPEDVYMAKQLKRFQAAALAKH